MDQNKPMLQPEGAFGEMQYFPVPTCGRPDTELPAKLSYIFLMRPRSGSPEQAMLYFYIARNLEVPLVSFTLSYRFSVLPIMVDDPQNPMYTYDYTDEEINRHEYIVCKINLPSAFQMTGCSAYVSAARTADGTEYTYVPEEFTYSEENLKALRAAAEVSEETADAPKASSPKKETTVRNKVMLGASIAACAAGVSAVIALLVTGASYIRFQRTMLTADVLLSAGQYTQAEQLAEETLSGSRFYRKRREQSTAVLRALCEEGRYAEAYRIVSDMPYASLMQDICREAYEASCQSGDYETAYAYAAGAPEPFTAEAAARAAEHVYDAASGTFDFSAYRAAQKTEDETVRNQLRAAVVSYASQKHDFVVAMRAADAVTDAEQRDVFLSDIYGNAIRFYIHEQKYECAADFIETYDGLVKTKDAVLEQDTKAALVDYFCKKNDAKSAFFLAKQFGTDASGIAVAPEDSVVRSHLDDFYFLLTADQKRAYHAEILAADTMLLTLEDGMLKGCPKFAEALAGKVPVVSVVTGTHYTVCIHEDGTVTVLPDSISGNPIVPMRTEAVGLTAAAQNCNDVVSAAVGEHHIVYLHADGTVTASGDNSRKQCDVNGDAWHDIVAVAAGNFFTIGLRKDGTVVAAGSDLCGQCDAAQYHNVTDIRACDQTTVLLFADGTVHIQGERSMGLHTANALSDVVRIRANASTIVAELADGRCVLCGEAADTGDTGSVTSWSNVKTFAVGNGMAACIRDDGRISVSGSHQPRNPAV